jgi:hypothetical protein
MRTNTHRCDKSSMSNRHKTPPAERPASEERRRSPKDPPRKNGRKLKKCKQTSENFPLDTPAETASVAVEAPTIAIDIWQPLRETIDKLAPSIPAEDLAVLRSQLAEVGQKTPLPAAPESNPLRPVIVRDRNMLADMTAKLTEAEQLVIDLETSGLDHRAGEIVGIGFAFSGATYYIPVQHRFEKDSALRPGQLPLNEVLAALQLPQRRLIAHNAKFEAKWLRHHGGIRCRFIWDTMIAARLLRSNLPADLKTLAVREMDVPEWDLSKEEIRRVQFLPIEKVASYCAKDCWYTLLIYERQQKCLV